MRFNIPLAWLQLSREKSRFMIALAGIAFAVILMFMQLGFQSALYDSAARFHQSLRGDLILISARSKSLGYMMPFSRRRLYQVLGVRGVESVSPVYVGFGDWKNPENGTFRTIYVYGFDTAQPTTQLPEVNQGFERVRLEQNILFDRASRLEYGSIAKTFEQSKPVSTELNGKTVKVVGLFTLGPSFGADGNIITSTANFLQLFPNRRLSEVTIGLIQLQPGESVAAAQTKIAAILANDIRVLTHAEFIEFEKTYWKTSTAIGFIFTLGVSMGFIVGTVIVYQILYTDVSSHLAEYATLKAMGYKNSYLLNVVFQEAIILAVLGYIPGFLLSVLLYELTQEATFLPLAMGFSRAFFVLVLSLLMCVVSGAIAIRRLRQADPAEIF
ncbi:MULTISPECIES: ABC transporter permease DevC [Cyanophyceae]|uniref:ABC transporter permease DevC n=1 Tax=Cyanophyceae TaxID=3028117 RepID=UPI00168522B5|nr:MULTISPECIES: ABC transporter permease DevC [Cyanophyceae]MBD1915172.1 FtsX-like permease family protein [Phormidium sp. FACHB-77]MBD2028440.1 FtsX-like permease family protein [Phormidium sp. FACHB-322]MBD2051854.1 FtsX-like permease family protein [Leptolyngbya sp. FACHB-60]